ncbi:uncharacterized protein LOC121970470 [Zingiber officinale]|uniref:Uncharacterized protein n=1 Tax=Zingiber officinale TaxID=94328 RepID=A0A8J5HYC1_ZINOF|nr:uncharacterized protein LOC121970470 [Zingiber officinale]KAG6532614.1 hypothetical protein ZIOFF_006463 [Zingiber officinale]
MEKVGDSQPSSSEPVSRTSKEMMEPPRRLGIVTPEICFEKTKSDLEKLKGGLSLLFIGLPLLFSPSNRAILGMMMIMGYLHTQEYKMELENERGDAINDAIKSIIELDSIKPIIDDDDEEEEKEKEKEEDDEEDFFANVIDNNDVEIEYFSWVGKIPEMSIPEVAARRTEVLYHDEKETDSGNYHNGRDRTIMTMDNIQRKTSQVRALQEIVSRVPEVADTKITMEHSKNLWQGW